MTGIRGGGKAPGGGGGATVAFVVFVSRRGSVAVVVAFVKLVSSTRTLDAPTSKTRSINKGPQFNFDVNRDDAAMVICWLRNKVDGILRIFFLPSVSHTDTYEHAAWLLVEDEKRRAIMGTQHTSLVCAILSCAQ